MIGEDIMLKKHFFSTLGFMIFSLISYGQVELVAGGQGNTYELITSVFAPGYNPIETPDCSHKEFGDHIDEIFNEELNAFVFQFHIHTSPDDDRCIIFDRQRNEIKTYDKSPNHLLGIENETVVYRWKFKLPDGFQSSPKFTHIHQLKSVGGPFASQPMYTLTTRKGNPDKLELRYSETDDATTLKQSDLEPFLDTWVEVTETIKYGNNGTYYILIKKVNDETILFEYSNNSVVNWRPDASFVRPKWGIYRSLIYDEDLRDEKVLFADFYIEELEVSDIQELEEDYNFIVSNIISDKLQIINLKSHLKSISIFNLQGKKVLNKNIENKSNINIDVSFLPKGSYMINLKGENSTLSELIFIQ